MTFQSVSVTEQSWDYELESVTRNLLGNCDVKRNRSVFAPNPEYYVSDGITGYFRKVYDIPDQLHLAYSSSKLRRRVRKLQSHLHVSVT